MDDFDLADSAGLSLNEATGNQDWAGRLFDVAANQLAFQNQLKLMKRQNDATAKVQNGVPGVDGQRMKSITQQVESNIVPILLVAGGAMLFILLMRK